MVAISNDEDSAGISASAAIPIHAILDPFRFVGSRDDLRKLLAQETEKHRQAISESLGAITKLQTVHNSLTPVNSLPAELLGLIFSHLVSQGDLLPKPSNFLGHGSLRGFLVDPPGGNRDIVRVTHVCKYWRAVGIHNPRLWTSFPIHRPSAVKVHLARSKSLPISLSLTHRLSSNIAPIIAPSIHRIRSIHIETTLADDIELLWDEFSLSAPNLEELFIEHLKHNFYLNGYAVGRVGRLPLMFNGEVPSLRVLTLRAVPSPFELFPPTLAHLDVGTVQGPVPPFAGLLKMLTNCPLLETLNLRGAWEWDEIDDHALVRNSVALPKLARTYLQLSPPAAHGTLLSSLSLPPHTDVSIVSVVEEHGDFENALSAITSRFIPPCFKGFRRLQLFREGMNWRLQAFRASDAVLDCPALDIDSLNPWAQLYPEWAGFLFDWAFDASQIETLVVVYRQANRLPVGAAGPAARDRTFDEWENTFRQLPALKTLRVMGLPAIELEWLLDALETRVPGSSDMVCSGLTTLEIFDVQDMSAAWSCLVDVAYHRIPRGMRESTLKYVELFNCKPCDPDKLELPVTNLGVEVIVDGENILVSAPGTPSSASSIDSIDVYTDIMYCWGR
ncbi:hypothetical protein LXA43DRAFT_1025286 [Ganoderma leucocontextum]|nr:hypothetical protein LXA43DRAFT_1025286 [Ganoderma leucocontextum]